MATLASRKTNQRNRDLAMIHIGKRELRLDNERYRKIIKDVGKVESGSAKDLDKAGRKDVLLHFKKMGVRYIHKSAKASGMHIPPAMDRAPQLSKIGAILADLGYPWSYADGIALKMFGIKKVRWLKPDQLRKVITALVHHQRRRKEAD